MIRKQRTALMVFGFLSGIYCVVVLASRTTLHHDEFDSTIHAVSMDGRFTSSSPPNPLLCSYYTWCAASTCSLFILLYFLCRGRNSFVLLLFISTNNSLASYYSMVVVILCKSRYSIKTSSIFIIYYY